MSSEDDAQHVDIESLDLGDMARHASAATFAPNWRSILITDGSIGIVVLLAGLALLLWVGWVGWVLIALGATYVGLVVRRFLQWRWIRQRAGLQ